MARNEEKAQSLLNRWTSMKQDFSDTFKECVSMPIRPYNLCKSPCRLTGDTMCFVWCICFSRRPYLASQCDNLKDAERWRRQIIREISKKVADIQNGALCAMC